MKSKTYILYALIVGVVSLVGVLLTIILPTPLERIKRSEQKWLSTEVEIMASETDGGGSKSAPCIYPKWKYKYNVGGQIYIGKNPNIEGGIGYSMCGTYQDAQVAANERPVGKHMTAYYDPTDPQLSTLDLLPPPLPGEGDKFRWATSIMILFGCIVTIVCILLVGSKSKRLH